MLDSLHNLQHHRRRCNCRRLDMCPVRVQACGREETVAVGIADGWKGHWEMRFYVVAGLNQELLKQDA